VFVRRILEKEVPKCRRKAYFIAAIHGLLPRIHNVELQQEGWAKVTELRWRRGGMVRGSVV